MTATGDQKQKVLLLGNIVHAHEKFNALSKYAELVKCESQNKEEFFKDLETKYSDITVIYNTFPGGIKVGGLRAETIEKLPSSLKFICHNGAGYDLIDVEACTKRGIRVSNTPDAVVNATADTTIYLILGALRNFGRLANELRAGNWCRTTPEASEPRNRVLGILGLGGIGRSVRDKAKVFGFSKIIYHNRNRLAPELEGDSEYRSFDELLAESDVVTVCLPLNANTRHIMDAKALAKCKDGVVIVNTGRGALIDEAALVDALNSGKVSSVGLDVYEKEPEIHPGLLKSPNALLLPHVGTHAVESRTDMEETTIRNVEAALTGKPLEDPVPEQKGKF